MNPAKTTLAQYVQQRNQIRTMFRQRPLNLSDAADRQRIAEEIDSALSPENLTCDGELSRSAVDSKYRMLTPGGTRTARIGPGREILRIRLRRTRCSQ